MSRRHRFRIAQLPVSAVPAGTAAGASIVTGVGRSTRVGSGAAAGVATVSGIAPGAMTPLLRSDIRAATFPLYGFDVWHRELDGVDYTETRIAGGSPSGNDSVRWTLIQRGVDGQDGFGGAFDSSLPAAPAQGAVRYVRYREKILSPVNWKGFGGGTIRQALDKTFILGNGGGTPHRIICYSTSNNDGADNFTNPRIEIRQGTGGGIVNPNHNVVSLVGTWMNLQFRIRSSSSLGANDGGFDFWLNADNTDINSPTRTVNGIEIGTGWGAGTNLIWGEGSYSRLETTGTPSPSAILELADFEYDDVFDANWHI